MTRVPALVRSLAFGACLLPFVTGMASAETLLHLGETATVMIAPDEIAAVLRAEATSPNAADAQSRVNAVVQAALAQARQAPGITVSTGSYGVWRQGPTPQDRSERWQASQSLTLTAQDGPALLTLVGALQQKGLAISALNWRLSRDAERAAHQRATKQALAALRGRAEEAAALLDLRFSQFKEVRLDSVTPQPFARAKAMPMAMAAAPAAPPSAEAEDIPVSATAEADIVLLPR